MKKIRVTHLSIGLEWGGAEILMADLLRRLDRARFEVNVVVLQKDGPVGDVLRQAGIPVTTLNAADRWDPRAYFRLKRYLAKEKPDIVHAHLLRANLLACLTRDDHAVVWHDHATGEWLSPMERFLERTLIVRSDAVIAASKNVRDRLSKRVPLIEGRLHTLPNAVDLQRWKSCAPVKKDSPIVGFVGRLDERFKGISFLLKSIVPLKAVLPNVKLVIVGGGKDESSLKDLCGNLGIMDSVVFMGPRGDVQNILPTFDVLALPSLSEGFGIVLLEAMAASLPVVASRVGGIPEVVVDQETGLLVPPADSMALSAALETLLKDPEKGKRMGQKGLERVKSLYDLGSILPKLEQIYSLIT